MSQFSAEWLGLRESHDIAARNPAVLEAVKNAFRDQVAISVLDLASGTGSTLRALHACLPPRQEWTLVDNDPAHLAQAASLAASFQAKVIAKTLDLDHGIERAFAGSFHLVTASALLDLVSSAWLDRLMVLVSARQLPIYAALTYDGRAVVEPVDSSDMEILASFNAHQRSDKGFGPALGPAAASEFAASLARHGYVSVQGRSDWILGTNDHAMQEAVFMAWAGAAEGPSATAAAQEWLARRRAQIVEGRSTLRVGHLDSFAYPMGMR
jgi:hypothetical protein